MSAIALEGLELSSMAETAVPSMGLESAPGIARPDEPLGQYV